MRLFRFTGYDAAAEGMCGQMGSDLHAQLHVCPIKRVRYYRLYASDYSGVSYARSAMTVTVREEH